MDVMSHDNLLQPTPADHGFYSEPEKVQGMKQEFKGTICPTH